MVFAVTCQWVCAEVSLDWLTLVLSNVLPVVPLHSLLQTYEWLGFSALQMPTALQMLNDSRQRLRKQRKLQKLRPLRSRKRAGSMKGERLLQGWRLCRSVVCSLYSAL